MSVHVAIRCVASCRWLHELVHLDNAQQGHATLELFVTIVMPVMNTSSLMMHSIKFTR